jgi:hypothetical protein
MFNLDRVPLDVPCPECRFENTIFYRQARLRDVLICRGCKANIALDDHMNQCRKARQQVNRALHDLESTIASLNKTLTIRL